MSKTVFILGAGASIAHSKGKFPSYNDFFSKARNLNLINNKNSGKVFKRYEDLTEYILNVMKIDILSEKSEIDIERLMTFIDIEIENAEDKETFQIHRKRLLEIIYKLFNRLSMLYKVERGDYNDFINHINSEDTIITFNWDLLLDRIIKQKEQYIKTQSLIFDEMDAITFNRTFELKYLSEKGFYLKLHGSIDWKYCANNNCGANNKVIITENDRCGRCFKRLNRLIIPPIINKQYKNYPFIEKMWTLASIQLESAEKIVIWGYRLPPTDFYSNWLLSKTSKKVEKVSIVNPDCILQGKWKEDRLNKKNFLQPFFDIYEEEKIISFKNYQDYLKGKRIK